MAKKKDENSSGGSGESMQVIVEIRVPEDKGAGFALEKASEINIDGFQLDAGYAPVKAGPPPDSEMAASLEENREETVFVRGTIAENKQKELEKQDNVVSVWKDTEIAPFASFPDDEDYSLAPTAPTGNCPIPPCDCDHGTAACAKGNMADVRKYLGVDKIWAAGHTGKNIVIGIVDGGITAQGRVAGGTIPNVIGGYPTADWGKIARWGRHGNMTATDALGMAKDSKIYDIRISQGNAISSALAGFQWAINQHKANGTPHILSNSWGIYQKSWDSSYATNPNHPFTRKVVEAINQGICVLFAAGNCGAGCPSGRCGNDVGPGKSIWGANGHPKVMTVGAANILGRLVGYSSQGPAALDPHKPDFCSISHFRGYFACDTGTSAACPVAAGVAALLKQCKPSLTQDAIKQVFKDTAKNIGAAGWDRDSGSGIIQAKKAYDKVCGTSGGGASKCKRYADAARRYYKAYRRTKNRKYLCYYYRYLVAYYRCLYQATKNRRYLCQYYRYLAAYYRCMYQITRNRKYLCNYYRYLAAYYRCMYSITKNRRYLCYYYRNLAAYYRCMYLATRNRSYLTAYKKYALLYRRCVGR